MRGHLLQRGDRLLGAAGRAPHQLLAHLNRRRALLLRGHGRDLLGVHPHLELRRVRRRIRGQPLAEEVQAALVAHDLQEGCLPVGRPQQASELDHRLLPLLLLRLRVHLGETLVEALRLKLGVELPRDGATKLLELHLLG